MKKSSGKVLTIFVVIIGILLISLTAISIFFFEKELERRKIAETTLDKTRTSEIQLTAELMEVKKQLFLLEEKNKEADEKINSLLDDVDLEKGLREEMKIENASLQEKLTQEQKGREDLEAQLKAQVKELEDKLAAETERNQNVVAQSSAVEQKNKELQQKLFELGDEVGQQPIDDLTQQINNAESQVNLPEIVVAPNIVPEGRVLSVDLDTEFVIVNLGAKDNVALGQLMSVYRGKEYLGDIKVTRVQDEMSAADFIPPFSSRKVRKNDQVILKNETSS